MFCQGPRERLLNYAKMLRNVADNIESDVAQLAQESSPKQSVEVACFPSFFFQILKTLFWNFLKTLFWIWKTEVARWCGLHGYRRGIFQGDCGRRGSFLPAQQHCSGARAIHHWFILRRNMIFASFLSAKNKQLQVEESSGSMPSMISFHEQRLPPIPATEAKLVSYRSVQTKKCFHVVHQ